jgi:hypothetical protein
MDSRGWPRAHLHFLENNALGVRGATKGVGLEGRAGVGLLVRLVGPALVPPAGCQAASGPDSVWLAHSGVQQTPGEMHGHRQWRSNPRRTDCDTREHTAEHTTHTLLERTWSREKVSKHMLRATKNAKNIKNEGFKCFFPLKKLYEKTKHAICLFYIVFLQLSDIFLFVW